MPLWTRTTRMTRTTRPLSLLLSSVLAAGTLTGCALLDLAEDCEGTDDRVKEMGALDILDSRPAGATVARGFEKVDAGCWADSGDVSLYAGRTYAFPGTRAEAAAHYRTAAARDGWRPDPEAPSDDLCYTREKMALRIVFLTAELLAEDGHGSRPDLTTGAGYSITVDSFANSDAEAGCQ
ncbi:hypothetical protein SLINC_0995 [Streptomyces lincolnensis]|uniref:Uncharacterized protein n=2 Tax=Streptomyces lincolnensis TaxID=1915 RepID=A0A1B1M3I4_STRLN|nr:hypothetical protein SLINC_0995 [Streptomyces lincolnensis]AXG52142.1 hypothetical protein SLCG_0987 [Streptomyces lincolnensis]